jgi:hypothetical protein
LIYDRHKVVRGFFAYHAVPTNGSALGAFYYYVKRIWLRTLRVREFRLHGFGRGAVSNDRPYRASP